jgi:hypothetical protein
MSSGDLELLDILYSAVDDGEPQLKVGDAATGKGVGQNVSFFASDGFVSQPIPPDSTGAAAQGLVATLGNDRFVVASIDGRYFGKAGSLSPGDRAIVSNCDACLLLSMSGNLIALKSTSMAVTLDGAGGNITATNGSTTMQIGASSGSMGVSGGGSVSVSSTNAVLQLGAISLTVDATGVSIASTAAPTFLRVNGTVVVVP